MRHTNGKAAPGRRKTIAVVDDDGALLELMQDLLPAEGYAVVTCKLAADALRCVKDARPDLIILDVRMPNAPDWAVVDEVKADPETARIPCIIWSAAVEAVEARAARLRELGYEIVGKPFDIDDFLGKVSRLLAHPSCQAGPSLRSE